MYSLSNIAIKHPNYFNLLIAFLPVSFILGNLAINLNVVLIIISSLLIFHKDFFKIKLYLIDKFFLLFFFFIIFTGIFNDIYFIIKDAYPEDYQTTKKSFSYLRYLLFYFSLRYLIEKKIINLKFFFISCLAASLFVTFDIFYQLIVGKDIFGYEIINTRKLSGPFGDELIAGGYLLRFSIFSLFLIPLFYNKFSGKLLNLIIPFLICTFISGVILSGNRMPLIMYFFTLFLIIIFQKQTRKYLIIFIATSLIVFSLAYKFNLKVKNNFDNFYYQINKMITLVSEKDFQNQKAPDHLKEFASFYNTWKMNKFIGGGIKNFWYYCAVEQTLRKKSLTVCNTHPHNYYLEIVTETGLIGLIIFLLIIFQILMITFYKKYITNSSLRNNNLIIPFIFLFICEIFPFKSTGSIFTTNNSAYLFFLISILIGIANRENLIENEKINI